MIRTVRKHQSVEVTVDIDAEDILKGMDDDEIIELLQAHGFACTRIADAADPWNKLADAIRMQADPMPIIRQTVSDVTGRIL